MMSIEKLADGLRSAQLLRPKLKILFEVAKVMTDTAAVDPAKNHRTHLAGSKLNTQKVTRARQAMAQVGGEKVMDSASPHSSCGLLYFNCTPSKWVKANEPI